MVRAFFKIVLFFVGFAAFAAWAGNKGPRSRSINTEHSDTGEHRVDHVSTTIDQLNNPAYISQILQERANNATCLIYHGVKDKCMLCGFLDSPDLEIDGIAYEHNYRTEDNNKYHFVKNKSSNKAD